MFIGLFFSFSLLKHSGVGAFLNQKNEDPKQRKSFK